MLYIDEQIPLDILAEYDNVRTFTGRTLRREDLVRDRVDALIVRSTTTVDRALLHDTMVRFVASATAGTDHMDLPALQESGMFYTNAPGSNANAVAEYCIAAMRLWSDALHGATLGIVGLGHVGSVFAEHAWSLGMNILVSDPPKQNAGHEFPPYVTLASLDTVVADSNVLSLHVPLTFVGPHATHHLLNASLLATLPSDALLINASRGEVVDEVAMREHVFRERIAVALDVWKNEPSIDMELALRAMIATPHIAGYSLHAKVEGARVAGRAWLRWKGIDTDAFERAMAMKDEASTYADEIRPVAEESDAFKRSLSHGSVSQAFDAFRKNYVLRPEHLRTPR
jgi:erythronate-4-phosphate dehydrogenase